MTVSHSPKRLLKLLSYGLVVAASLFFGRELVQRFNEIPPIAWNAASVAVFTVCVIGVVFTVGLIGLMWRLLLLDQSVRIPLSKAVQIVAISQIGKYLPGNVGHFAGRALLAHQAGIPLGITASTILIETAWTLAIGSGFAAMAFLFYLDAHTSQDIGQIGMIESSAAALGLLFVPWVGIQVVNRFMPRLSNRLGGGSRLAPPRLTTAVTVSLLMVACFAMLGVTLKLQAQWFFQVENVPLVPLTLLFTLAWLVGYVVPGAPGGLGVREAMMVLVLTPLVGAGAAVGLGVSMRVVTVAGDAAAFVLGLALRRATR
ncbi:MAG: hypothetical protein CTY21_12410 [Methylomonas sp.]|nr:MAG: hypothetical protein CTY21_12410 [Methylomonas sp.]